MKLLNKTSLFYLLFAIPVMAVCSVIGYHLIYSEVKDNIDDDMWKDMQRIEMQLEKKDTIVNVTSVLDSDVSVSYAADTFNVLAGFTDTVIYDHYEQEDLPFRILHTTFRTAGHNYEIRIKRTYLESDDLVTQIVITVVMMFACLLIGFIIINVIVAKRLWKPFYRTLEILQDYELDKGSSVHFDEKGVKEFKQMNTVLNKMTQKIYQDFINQKQFAENASHEMQTPLAVIKNKIELLIQSKTLSAGDMEMIQGIYNSANRLSQINRALLLLSKIESNQFVEVKDINLGQQLERTLRQFDDQVMLKNIRIEKMIDPEFFISINPVLVEVLLSNLLQNAIRHNVAGGKINIRLSDKELHITNTGLPFSGDPNEMFSRFRKSDQSNESIGLGMAIIKQVCDHYGLPVRYTVEGDIHSINIRLK